MLKSLVKFFIDPFNIFWLLLLVTAAVWLMKKKRLLRWLAASTLVWFLLISTPLLPNAVLNSLEDRHNPIYINELTDREADYHIIVLGGGHGFDDRLPANSLLSDNARGRLMEGIRLHRQLPNSKLILSGFSSSGGTTQAEMLQKSAVSMGVDKTNTILQKEPGNTYEEAEIYTETYDNTYPVILVTNAAHMQRAMNVFLHFGADPLASPTNYRLKGSRKYIWAGLPSMSNIENLRVGINEYVGILWYRLTS